MKSARMKPLIFVVLSVFAPIHAMNSGPIGPVNIFTVVPCNPDVNSVDMKVVLGDSDGHKDASFSFKIPFEVNEETYVVFTMDKWENNVWQENFFQNEGGIFDFVEKFLPDMWTHARAVAEPEITEERLIPAGSYVIKKLVESPEVLTMDKVFYGRFRAFFTLSDDEHDDFLCLSSEFEALEP